MNYSRNCEEITLYSFDKVCQGEMKYIVIGWDGFEDIDLDYEKANENWKNIFNEYCILTDDNKIVLYYEVLTELMQLKSKRFVVQGLCDMFMNITDPELQERYYEEFKYWGFPMDKEKAIEDEVQRVTGELRFMENKIDLKQNELKALGGDEEQTPLMKQIVAVEKLTGRNNIDPHKISVAKWIYIKEQITNKRE